jgi:hypothetical protein
MMLSVRKRKDEDHRRTLLMVKEIADVTAHDDFAGGVLASIKTSIDKQLQVIAQDFVNRLEYMRGALQKSAA